MELTAYVIFYFVEQGHSINYNKSNTEQSGVELLIGYNLAIRWKKGRILTKIFEKKLRERFIQRTKVV